MYTNFVHKESDCFKSRLAYLSLQNLFYRGAVNIQRSKRRSIVKVDNDIASTWLKQSSLIPLINFALVEIFETIERGTHIGGLLEKQNELEKSGLEREIKSAKS